MFDKLINLQSMAFAITRVVPTYNLLKRSLPSPLLILLDSERKEPFEHQQSNGRTQRPIDWVLLILRHLPDRNSSMSTKNNPRYHRFDGCNQLDHCFHFKVTSKATWINCDRLSSPHPSKAVDWRLTRTHHHSSSTLETFGGRAENF